MVKKSVRIKWKPVLVVIVLAAFITIAFSLFYADLVKRDSEINGDEDFETISEILVNIAKKEGASSAIEFLKHAPVKENTDIHLLGHVIGEEIYKKVGIGGIKNCTQDFQYACSHAVVIGYLREHGDSDIGPIIDSCLDAPGGKLSEFQCFHGVGHGFVASAGYDFEKGVGLCSELANNDQAIACVGGSVMEIVNGGLHDKDLWEKNRSRYLGPDDPLAPCDRAFVPDAAKPMCYSLITPQFFIYSGGDLNNPESIDFVKAFGYCSLIQVGHPEEIASCYGGFGKEIAGLAKGRMIREIDGGSDLELRRIYELCSKAGVEEGIMSCLKRAQESLYYGGDNSYAESLRLCGFTEGRRDGCYKALIRMVDLYGNKTQQFCNDLPHEYLEECSDE